MTDPGNKSERKFIPLTKSSGSKSHVLNRNVVESKVQCVSFKSSGVQLIQSSAPKNDKKYTRPTDTGTKLLTEYSTQVKTLI